MRSKKDLFNHQREAIDTCVHKKRLALFLRPGAGKTAIALHALAELKPVKTLIVAPPRLINDRVWEKEARQWEDTALFTFNPLNVGPTKRIERLKEPGGAIDLISYNLLRWLVQQTHLKPYDAIVFDELSFMKAPGAKRFRSIRNKLARIPVRLGLTGSPVGNSLMNLWSELWCIDDEKPLGRTFTEFRARHFQEVYDYVWKPFDDTEVILKNKVMPWVYSTENYSMQEKLHFNIISTKMSAKERRAYEELEENYFYDINDNDSIEVFSSLSLHIKLRQIASGNVYDAQRISHKLHSRKTDLLVELVEELQSEPLLVFYQFLNEIDAIKEVLPAAEHINSPDAIKRWNSREIPILLAHPASAGHGLNLQFGGSNICWFNLPWSLEQFDQANKRLDRPGQKSSTVMVHILSVEETIDEVLYKSLMSKGELEKALISYVSKHCGKTLRA